jgi:SAM-dependent methyltransferase
VARVSTPDFWDGLYASGGDGWELGAPAPPLVDFVERTPPPRGRVAVLGCGRGHDARYLATRGYEVVGFDFSTAAVTAAQALARRDGVRVSFEQRDIFALGARLPMPSMGSGSTRASAPSTRAGATSTCGRWPKSYERAGGSWRASSRCAR